MMGFRPLLATLLFDALRWDEDEREDLGATPPAPSVDDTDPVAFDEMPPPVIPDLDSEHSFRVGGRLARRLGSRVR